MQIFIVIALIIAIVAVVFALQNLTVVTVTLLLWKVDSSLALVLLISLAAGVLISLLASLPSWIRSRLALSNQKKKLAALETERNTLQQKADETDKEMLTLEEQVTSLSAELERYHIKESAVHPEMPTPPTAPTVPPAAVNPPAQ